MHQREWVIHLLIALLSSLSWDNHWDSFLKFLFYLGEQSMNNAVFVSGVQQSDSVTHIHLVHLGLFYQLLLFFSGSVMPDSLWPHGLQHTQLHCPSLSPRVSQNHAHWVCDAIQPSHPLSRPFPPALNLSQHQGLFQWVSSSHQVAKVLELQLQHQSLLMFFPIKLLHNVE